MQVNFLKTGCNLESQYQNNAPGDLKKVLLKYFGLPVRGKAKRKIHARYPFLGGGTYQPPVLSVLYLQVGYQPVAAGKSRVIYAGPTRFPYSLSDNYTRRPTRCPYPLSDENKRKKGASHHRYPEDMTKCWGSKRGKGMVHTAGARQVSRKYRHPYIF